MRQQLRSIALCAGVALMTTAGCMSTGGSTSGTKITQNEVNHIVKRRTTRAQLEALLGPPTYVSMMGDGRRMLFYSYMNTRIGGANTPIPVIPFAFSMNMTTRQQTLQVILSKHNVVQDYEFSDKTTGTTGSTTISPMGGYSHYNATTIETPKSER
jgi:outer membrane protein assembly factor BamE (lipoprotein component of BamABCDE complex)